MASETGPTHVEQPATPSVRQEIDAIVSAWRRDGGILARRTTLVERIKEWAEGKLAEFDAAREVAKLARVTFLANNLRGEGATRERRRCSAIVTAVAREIDDETAERLSLLKPGEEGDNGIAVGAVRAAREIYTRINQLQIDPATGKPAGMTATAGTPKDGPAPQPEATATP